MKNALLFTFACLCAAPAYAVPPRGSALELWLNRATQGVDRVWRIELATNLPGLFEFHFICQFQPAQGEPISVIPGDTVDAAVGGTLRCPDSLELRLEKGTKLEVSQVGPLPIFTLHVGY